MTRLEPASLSKAHYTEEIKEVKMSRWHISFEHHYFKSKRTEYVVRIWRKVKYKKPPKPVGLITLSDPRD